MSRENPTGFTTRRGYIQRYLPNHPMALADGYVPEHRLVMSNHLGRYLSKDEQVHHKDENKLNNTIDNLELLSLVDHMKEHWAARSTSCKFCGIETKSKISLCKKCFDKWKYYHMVDSKKHNNKEICPFCVDLRLK